MPEARKGDVYQRTSAGGSVVETIVLTTALDAEAQRLVGRDWNAILVRQGNGFGGHNETQVILDELAAGGWRKMYGPSNERAVPVVVGTTRAVGGNGSGGAGVGGGHSSAGGWSGVSGVRWGGADGVTIYGWGGGGGSGGPVAGQQQADREDQAAGEGQAAGEDEADGEDYLQKAKDVEHVGWAQAYALISIAESLRAQLA